MGLVHRIKLSCFFLSQFCVCVGHKASHMKKEPNKNGMHPLPQHVSFGYPYVRGLLFLTNVSHSVPYIIRGIFLEICLLQLFVTIAFSHSTNGMCSMDANSNSSKTHTAQWQSMFTAVDEPRKRRRLVFRGGCYRSRFAVKKNVILGALATPLRRRNASILETVPLKEFSQEDDSPSIPYYCMLFVAVL